MKNRLLFILTALLCHEAMAQQQVGFEQYYYVQEKKPLVMVPMAHYQSKTNWYTEVRYNYEDLDTFSAYGGKIFSKEGKVSYSLIPILGGVVGKFKGGSVGLNANVEYKNLYLSSQSQYTFSAEDKTDNFFYSWSEVGYEIWSWMYAGLALQHTSLYHTRFELGETGFLIGLTAGKWIFPLYGFSPMSNNRYFVLGINRTL